MPAPFFIILIGGDLLVFSIFQALKIPTPFKISSQPKVAPMRPGTYMAIEDIIAVHTSVGRACRKAINDRYEASPMFRQTMHQLKLFWAILALAVGAGATAAVADKRVPQTVVYGIGMSSERAERLETCADWFDRLGCTSALDGHTGFDHDSMGTSTSLITKREGGMEQRRKSLIMIRFYTSNILPQASHPAITSSRTATLQLQTTA